MEDKKTAIANAMLSADSVIKEAEALLIQNGQTLDLQEWITIKDYATRFNLSTQTVTNWISRGIVPRENIQVVERLNGLRLIKAISYKDKLSTDFV